MWRTLALLAALATLAIMGCEERHRTVHMEFGESNEGFDGFVCRDTSGLPFPYLLARARGGTGQFEEISVVVDLIRLGGDPGCRPSQVISWCESHACDLIPAYRTCHTVDLGLYLAGGDVLSDPLIRAAMDDVFADLRGQRLIATVPDETVLVRVVGTVETCAAVTPSPTFVNASLVGCMVSSPVNLAQMSSSSIYVGLDKLWDSCGMTQIESCATQDFTGD